MQRSPSKAVGQVYGSTCELPKSQVRRTHHQRTGPKVECATERNCGYIISSNASTIFNGSVLPPPGASKHLNTERNTPRRKSARSSNKTSRQCSKQSFPTDDVKRLPTTQPIKGEKVSHSAALAKNMHDNKIFDSDKEVSACDVAPHQQQLHHHHHKHHCNHHSHHQYHDHDEDKDDDAEEFFELMRRTVESAIVKSMSDLINRKFSEISSKVDRFSVELNTTNALLCRMQNEIKDTIGHYGEENTRHFRYLCIKSEYDKMVYQHFLATDKLQHKVKISSGTKMSEKRNSSAKPHKTKSKDKCNEDIKSRETGACVCCRTKNNSPPDECKEPPPSTAASPPKISQNFSEETRKEILERIKTLGNKRQENKEAIAGTNQKQNIVRHENLVEFNKAFFDEIDEDAEENDYDWEISSDEMTPRNSIVTDGGATHRSKNGAGDS